MYKKMLSIAQQSLFPPRCPLCHQLTNNTVPLCHPCLGLLSPLEDCCSICGIAPIKGDVCGKCVTSPPPFQRFIGGYLFEKKLKEIIHDYKYNQQTHWIKTLAALFYPIIEDNYQGLNKPMALIPLPSHPVKTRQRGFNPILELAKKLAKKTHIPLINKGISRYKLGVSQSTLPLNQRHENVRHAFSSTIALPPHIAIVDDVMTSGATIGELAKTLRQSGAMKIDIWILARTLKSA